MRLVFIHGPAASGKLTVARALSARTGLPVFHNHLAADALLAVFPFGDPDFIRLREEIWTSVFRAAALAGRSLIFTFTPEPTVAPGLADRVRTIWETQGGRIDYVRLTVSREEQERRIGAESRKAFGKLASLDLLRELREGFEACEAAMPEADLVIDTGAMGPDAAAQAIAEALDLS